MCGFIRSARTGESWYLQTVTYFQENSAGRAGERHHESEESVAGLEKGAIKEEFLSALFKTGVLQTCLWELLSDIRSSRKFTAQT